MKTYVALFRGINVVGKNRLPMKELKALLEDIGAADVRTYIQSGNAVFRSAVNDAARLGRKIGAAVKERRGFEPFVLLLEARDLEKAIAGNPFPEAIPAPNTLHLIFLTGAPKKDSLQSLENLRSKSERFKLKGRVFYLHAPEGIGRSKLVAGLERAFGVLTTARNWRTVTAVRDMVKTGRHLGNVVS
jgi:uncharacterized protein (DUF1697 family)